MFGTACDRVQVPGSWARKVLLTPCLTSACLVQERHIGLLHLDRLVGGPSCSAYCKQHLSAEEASTFVSQANSSQTRVVLPRRVVQHEYCLFVGASMPPGEPSFRQYRLRMRIRCAALGSHMFICSSSSGVGQHEDPRR